MSVGWLKEKTFVAFFLWRGRQNVAISLQLWLRRRYLQTSITRRFCSLVSQFGLDSPVVLLTGSMTAKQKREAYARLENEKNALIIGTHALIQEKADFSNSVACYHR